MITVEYGALPYLIIEKLNGECIQIYGPHFGPLSGDTLFEVRSIRESRRRSKADINYHISIVEEFGLSWKWFESFYYLWARAVK